ncbi:hypothetical protein Tco_1258476 [Tanacetum coccineum]
MEVWRCGGDDGDEGGGDDVDGSVVVAATVRGGFCGCHGGDDDASGSWWHDGVALGMVGDAMLVVVADCWVDRRWPEMAGGRWKLGEKREARFYQ